MKRNAVLALTFLLLLACPIFASRWYGMTGSVTPSQPHADDAVRIALQCSWADACVPEDVQVFRDGTQIYFDLYDSSAWRMCAMVITPWGTTQSLGYLPVGTYDVYVSCYAGLPWPWLPLGSGTTEPGQGPELVLTFTVLPAPIASDINEDGGVDVIDLLFLVDAFGSTRGGPKYSAACDFNADDSVDVVDLLAFVPDFGK